MKGKYSCPHCGQHVVIDDAPAGLAINCPNCGAGYTLSNQTSRKELLRSPFYWGVVATLALVIPAAFFLHGKSSAPVSMTTPPKSNSLSQSVAVVGTPLFKSRPLSAWLEDVDGRNRDNPVATRAREVFKQEGKAVVPDVIGTLNNLKEASRPRGNAALALGWAGSKDGPEIDALWAALNDKQAYVRFCAVYSLRRLGVDPQRVVPKAIEMLDDPNSEVRLSAAENLGLFGEPALPAIPKLEQMLNSEEPKTRGKVVEAIRRIKATVPPTQNTKLNAAMEALYATDFDSRSQARSTIQRMGSDVVPELRRVLADTSLSSQHRAHAAEGLGYTGDAGGPEIGLLVNALKDEDRLLRASAIEALSRLKPGTRVLVPLCISMLDDPDNEVRRRAAVGLGSLGPEAVEAIPSLQKAAAGKNDSSRTAAIQALARISPGTRPTE